MWARNPLNSEFYFVPDLILQYRRLMYRTKCKGSDNYWYVNGVNQWETINNDIDLNNPVYDLPWTGSNTIKPINSNDNLTCSTFWSSGVEQGGLSAIFPTIFAFARCSVEEVKSYVNNVLWFVNNFKQIFHTRFQSLGW
jgi:hypothetical protein